MTKLHKEKNEKITQLSAFSGFLAVHDLLISTRSSITIGYLYDMSLEGEANTIAEDFVRLEKSAAKLGLTLTRNKCEVAGLTDATRSVLTARGILLKEVNINDLIS